MKKIIAVILATVGFLSIAFGIGYQFKDDIYIFYQEEILKKKDNITITTNKYYKENDYSYVQNTNDFIAKNETHLKNIFYTIINSGTENFTFYCDEEYKNCVDDAIEMVNNQDILSNINNFVHPFNSFNTINISYDEYGEIIVQIDKVYTEEEIEELNTLVEEIINDNIKTSMTTKEKVETIHNYIINNGSYATDKIREENNNKEYNKANDILIDKYGICSAYTDAMALFLYKFDLDNYKIATDSHIWNLVKVGNEWLHLDLTWDDPITENGEDKLEIYFLLIDNDRLEELDTGEHEFNKEIYKEAL